MRVCTRYVSVSAGAWGRPEALDLLELELQVVVGCPSWAGSLMLHPAPSYLIFFDMYEMSALSHNENMIGYACCLSLVFEEVFANGYSVSLLHSPYFSYFAFLRILLQRYFANCLTLPSSLLKGAQCPHQPTPYLPVSYTPPFVVVVLWFFFLLVDFSFQMCLKSFLFLVHAHC